MENKKVLVLVEYGWRNGGENSWLATAPLLRAEGWEFLVACPAGTELSRFLEQSEFETVAWSCFDDAGNRKTQDQIRDNVAFLIKKLNPAVVHCNSLSTSRLAGPVTNELGKPSVGCLRDIIKLSKQAVVDINQLSCLVAVSIATLRFHQEQGLDPTRSRVVYNGLDLTEFRPREPTGYLHNELNLPLTRRLISCIGQIGMRKGTDTVIDAFAELADRFEDIELLITGIRNSNKEEAGQYERKCRTRYNNSVVARRIHWLGRRKDTARILNETTLLLHGARQEPLGRVLLEAMATGCPFVASEVGGTPEIVRGCDCDLLTCQVDSVADMAGKAGGILSSGPDSLRQISDQMLQVARRRFDAKNCAREYNLIYRSLLAQQNTTQ